MKKWKVYLSEYIHPDARAKLEEVCDIVSSFDTPEELDGILIRQIRLSDELMRKAVKLKTVAVHGVGTDGVNMEIAAEQNIEIITTPGANSRSVAELAVGLMMDLSRKITMNHRGLTSGKYTRADMSMLVGSELTGKKVGIIGLGNIGTQIGKILKYGFACDLYAYSGKSQTECEELGYCKVEMLEELFSRMDIISVNVPLNEQTRNLIDQRILEYSNPDLLLVNTARGGIVNEEALYHALKEKRIRGAACDVFTIEPPEVKNPLLTLDNFVATFHIGSNTEEALYRVGMQSVEGMIRVLNERDHM